ncbi:DUF305 domain-containing protein [Streptomyces sp. NPDC093260]|uniref:DUF305 domain-containing protein n=1 Tax=Streptomyces sp. NPDC093260 TaxID=3155073 RepID=UPI0034436C7C
MAIRRSPLRRSVLRRSAALAAATTAALVLTACGGGADSASPSRSAHSGHGATADAATPSTGRTGHNAQDVTFAQQMIPHHRQAVAMADLAPTRARSQQVKDLAAQIRKAQDPEIATMTGWLQAWGARVPESDASGTAGMPGMDHSGHPGSGHSAASMPAMPGMMSDADMSGLEKMSGDVFDRAFLRMMIDHHEGALDMARTEQAKGAYGPATALAKSIAASQSAEIAGMRKMLGER